MPRRQEQPTVSAQLSDGRLVETIYNAKAATTTFLVGDASATAELDHVESVTGQRLTPYRADNSLIAHRVLLLPEEASTYKSVAELVADVRAFIHRYVDISSDFELLATHYVLFTWVYDAFGEVPYLRVQGDYGSGKSRFLTTVGNLVYKPIFASGASTVAPIFRILDAVAGTLVIDESDFRLSDEKTDIVKILNNGNARGFPVLRCEVSPTKEVNPRAFSVFGPKLIATRGPFDDPALESRCISEVMTGRRLRSNIPINLPNAFHAEALALRNQLLRFRFATRLLLQPQSLPREDAVEPRIAQVLNPLLQVVDDEVARRTLEQLARRLSSGLKADRADSLDGRIVAAIEATRAHGSPLSSGAIAENFSELFDETVSPRFVGSVLRRRLGLTPVKRQGVFVIPEHEHCTVDKLIARYCGR